MIAEMYQALLAVPKRLRGLHVPLLLLQLILAATGILFIYGIGQQTGGSVEGYWLRQIIFVCMGLVIMLVIAGIDYAVIGRWTWVVFAIAVWLLVMVLVIGEATHNARSWIRLAPGLTLQPAEPAKFAVILAASWYATRPHVNIKRWQCLLPLGIIAGLPVLLIGKQPDLGSAMVIIPVAAAIIFIAGIPKRWIAYAAAAAILLAPIIYTYGLKPHQRERLITFLTPSNDFSDAGYNARQSRIAVGSGRWAGKGFMNGTQNDLGFLPRTVTTTDFIFAVIAEEAGFLGAMGVLSLFLLMMLSCAAVAVHARDMFGRCLVCGVIALLCTHVYINAGMTMGAAPIIGINLPFISYGGSFILTMFACMGLVQSVYIFRNAEGKRYVWS